MYRPPLFHVENEISNLDFDDLIIKSRLDIRNIWSEESLNKNRYKELQSKAKTLLGENKSLKSVNAELSEARLRIFLVQTLS